MFHSNQPITIDVAIGRADIGRVLIDTGASRDILYYDCLIKMGMKEPKLSPYAGLLEGFTNHTVKAKGTLELEVTIGEGEFVKTAKVNFMVIDLKSQFNAILGITAQAALGIVASIPHQKIKFNTPAGIACIKNRPEDLLSGILKRKRAEADATNAVKPKISETTITVIPESTCRKLSK